ncbi:MAG TPA: cation transporter, partial [Actinomycetota bacterium]|nr:cation transporter [Actinomycetota bacterium]
MARTVDLPIEGMTCGACAARIERGLGRLDGVASASVNLAAERATVTYDPAVTGPPAFADKVAALGYAVGRAPDAADPATELRRRLVVAAALTAPVLALSMVPAWQYPGWEWLAAVLASPVVLWAGAGFHKAALAGLRHPTATMDTLVSRGTLAAWGWSTAALLAGDADAAGEAGAGMAGGTYVYFEVAAIIV